MEASDLKPVRVRIRQIDYLTTETNPLGNEVDAVKTAYGPGMSPNDPANHPELDPDSQQYADLASDYKFGQLVLLRPQQYIGLITSGAVRDLQTQTVTDEATGEESEQEVIEEEELLDVNTATVDELVDWIRTERPTVNDVVQASGGDPEAAKRLLEAERDASDGEPRKGVVDGLSAVIARG